MIKFFRRIRQQLLSENRFTRYFLYAVGEIVLVVVGILIALQINNWNTNRIAANQMTDFLINLKNDLQADTSNFSRSISSYKDIVRGKEYIKLSNFENISTDSLLELISVRDSRKIPVQTTFNTLTNSGITQISNNKTLSKRIYEYYTTDLEWLNVMNSWEESQTIKDGDFWWREVEDFEYDAPETPNFQNNKERRNNLLKLLSLPKTRNNLKSQYVRKVRMLNKYQEVKEEAHNLMVEIEKELNKR